MNTTDCEKIGCKLEKQFHSKFDVNFGGEAQLIMTDNMIKRVNTIENKNYSGNEEEFSSALNSSEEKNKGSANCTLNETLKTIQPDTCTTFVFIPTTEPKLPPQFNSLVDTYNDEASASCNVSLHPLSERCSPLGANFDDVAPSSELLSPASELELFSSDSQDKHDLNQQEDATDFARLKGLEEEQEVLTSSLMALTSHFAHVQLRVRQIVEAPSVERDELLKDLEEFAFQGIPESHSIKTSASFHSCSSARKNCDDRMVHEQQFELIKSLKNQLTELEKTAYESGAPVLPQHILLEKQKIIIDELKRKLNFKVDDNKLPELTAAELKHQVDNAIGEFIGPLKMKEQLVAQLKTQITDLERFIAFLQCDTDDSSIKTNTSEKFSEAYNSYAAKKKKESNKTLVDINKMSDNAEMEKDCTSTNSFSNVEVKNISAEDFLQKRESLHTKAHGLMNKASLLMQMFATTHFSSKQEHFQRNTLKQTEKGNHWGDLRAQLEVDIQEVASLAATLSFDCEKLTKFSKAMKKSKTFVGTEEATMKNSVTKFPSLYSRIHSSRSSLKQKKQLRPYSVSSGSDDEDFYANDYYDMQQQNNRRMVRCARIRGDTINTLIKELTTAVRKNFAITLMKLMQYGLRTKSMPPVTSSLIVPFMRCINPSPVFIAEHSYNSRDFDTFSSVSSKAEFAFEDSEEKASRDVDGGGLFSSGSTRAMHAWELILDYYYIKRGDEYNNTPARKLSQSFNLEIVNSQVVTAKQNFLSTVGSIISMHRPYKRSYNAQFKAFVCAGLNCHQLVEWLNLIFSSTDLIENYYTSYSYVACTGFRDALRSIDALTKYDFDLPVDLAIRHFRNLERF